MSRESGVLLRDNCGNVYFLRPEVLDAAQVPDAMAEAMIAKADTSQADPKQSQPSVIGSAELRVIGDLKISRATDQALTLRPSSTIMCPW